MKITSFINSNDIREYLEKINYKFTPLEAAWLIYQCRLISIPEKQEAFKEIIRTMPDCEVKKRFNTVPQKSLHEFLGKYISLQNKFIDTFFNDKDSVYRLIYIYNNGDDFEDNTVYSSFDSLKNSIELEEDVVFLKCVKCTPNSDENNITAEFTTDMKRFSLLKAANIWISTVLNIWRSVPRAVSLILSWMIKTTSGSLKATARCQFCIFRS